MADPVSFVDPLGLEIAYGNHRVALWFHHSKIIIIPDNQNRYVNDPRFQNINDAGLRYATIGAGEEGDNLVAGINRDRDVSQPCNNRTALQLPNRYATEDEAIDALFRMLTHYNTNQVPYTLFPTQGQAEYNSNSFIRGIGEAAGYNMPVNTGVNTPGYSNPVPANRFIPPVTP